MNVRQRISQLACGFLVSALVVLGLSACGGGSDTSSRSDNDSTQQTKLSVGLTDAEGDFLSYTVDVTNITLTRANGAVVNVLPRSTRVDFAQYVEVTELLTILDVPSGRYDSASMSLDFSAADIIVQNDAGDAIVATAQDMDGMAMGEVSVDIMFNDDSGFVLAPGVPAHVTLDFDLDASNQIDIDGDSATVTVQPILIADTIREEPKPFRIRGLLTGVNAAEENFALDLHPFRVRNGVFGDATVHVASDTRFEVDGEVYDVEAGLAALADKDLGSAVVVSGEWDNDAREYVADSVYAGSSVAWDDADVLRGTVVARTGNTLEVRGALIELADGTFMFNDTFSVDVSVDTVVTVRGGLEASIDDISVGTGLYVLGEYDSDTLNATAGIVRIVPSRVSGTVVTASPLTMDLGLINGRRAALYDFTGTGTSEATDADPELYEVNTGSLDLSGVSAGDPVRARGLVAQFGTAPEDFYASTLIDNANVRGHMVVNYGRPGADDAVSNISEAGVQLDVSSAQGRHHIVIAGIAIDLLGLDQAPLLVPGGERGVYSVWINGRLEVYTFYASFARALQEHLDEGAVVVRSDAHGYFDRGLNTFTSQRMGIVLNSNEA